MKTIKDENFIQEKVDLFLDNIEKVLESDKYSIVWLSKNKDNQPTLSARLKGNPKLVVELGELSYVKFCKTFFKSVIDKYLTSEKIGFSPVMNKVYSDGIDTWIGYPLQFQNIETHNNVFVCFIQNKEVDNVLNYFKTLCDENNIEQ